jgi:lipopolysaccharide export system permease protein
MFLHTIHRYIVRDVLVIFALALTIFTFVLYIGAVIQAIDLVARGVSVSIILRIFIYNIPYILSFSIPVSILTAVLLLFSRISLDGEITAMKASGQTLGQICAPVVLFSVFLSLVCVYINAVASPDSHFARRQLRSNIGAQDPLDLLEEGRFVKDFPGSQIYVGKKTGNRIHDVVVYEMGMNGIDRTIRAESGVITNDETNEVFVIDLFKVRIDAADDNEEEDSFNFISADHYVEKLPYSELNKTGTVKKRTKDFTLSELIRGVRDVRSLYPSLEEPALLWKNRSGLLVEASKRIAMSFSCLAFTMIGIPLGIKSRRKESSVGIIISLAVVTLFFFFVIIAEAFVDRPRLHPELILWIPVFASQGIGLYLLRRMD